MHPLGLFALLWGRLLLPVVFCQEYCRVQDGKDGLDGIPGRDGMPGLKGDKGQPALQVELNQLVLDELKGEMGSRGLQGPPGQPGLPGSQGLLGAPGPKGPIGSSQGIDRPMAGQKPAFSVLRHARHYPSHNQRVAFDVQLSNINNYFDLKRGTFTCRVPGVYYFVFHAVSEGRLCLRLKSDSVPPVSLSFCDFNPRSLSHVVSGGAVLTLAQSNNVWIEPFKDGDTDGNKMSRNPEKGSAVFNGFLIYHTE